MTVGLRFLGFGGNVGFFVAGVATGFNGDRGVAFTMFMLGGIMGSGALGLMLWDLADAPEAARRANREAGQRGETSWLIPTPTVGPHGIGPEWTF